MIFDCIRKCLAGIFFLVSFIVFGQIPSGYYDGTEGLMGEALKTTLHQIIDDHTAFSYTQVKTILETLEEDPDNSNNVILLYKRTSVPKSSFGGGIDDWNREHLWPNSHGDFGQSAPEGTDLHHMRATDASVNSERGDKDFDNCQAAGSQHPEATLCYYTSNAWEPPDEMKGDIARAMFYMEVRYEGGSGEVDLELEDFYTSPSPSPGNLGVLSTLMEWHENDPVSAAEISRNNLVYNNYQGNRNPFVDHPEFVNLIWGDGFAPEPVNHPSGFNASNITLTWEDPQSGDLPDAYLIRMSDTGFESIADPVDGIPVNDDFWNKNVDFGVKKCIFSGLTSNVTYYFKIYGYQGSGNGIDYKVDEAVETVAVEMN